jgi:hypothetical protein
MVGFSFVRDSGGLLNKAQSLVVLAALVLLAALSLSRADGGVQVGFSIVARGTQVVEHTPPPKLAESTAQSSPNSGPSQTDNSTAPVSSSGAVKASFTVVSRPVGDQGENGTSTAGNTERDLNSTSATTPAQVMSRANAGDQPMQNDRSSTALDARLESGRLSTGWAFLVTAWLVGIALVCGLALVRAPARR